MPRAQVSNGTAQASRRRAKARPQIPFSQRLVLNQWILSLFNVQRFDQLAEHLRHEVLEGFDESNVHHFHHALTAQLFNRSKLPDDILLEYDQNIVKHTQRLNERRNVRGQEPIVWKYFQYLTLLFTEIYLDQYFRQPGALLDSLNRHIADYNTDRSEADQITPFNEEGDAWPQLNKLAYWSATGSGKTLLMHANILQYKHHLNKHGRQHELNRIILLTPNEGLSHQHLVEFESSGIAAELFSKDLEGLFVGHAVQILDIHKLAEEMGNKTIAIDAFESNNLLLIDEGHRGATSGEEGAWLRFRNALCEKGFSFEYSATFGQAVKGRKALIDVYAKSIIFDYSYRYFYNDGFGKDYEILNLDKGTQRNNLEPYLVGCLLAFFQQLRLYGKQYQAFRPFNIEKPLWIFVGGSVTKTLANREATDIIEILKFLNRYLSKRNSSIQQIDRVLNKGLVTTDRTNLFDRRFEYLNSTSLTASQVFDETLTTVFNSTGGGQLYVENLKGAAGEIALRVGDNDPFGLINVGDDGKLMTLCQVNGLQTREREFSESLFQRINTPQSTINLLIGSKKFTEGWNSWRVSTMGLMNVGRTEGSQIIQLFGRGVRLKGYNVSLKRSGKSLLPEGMVRPKSLATLETLSIFGIRADYMTQFRDFLEEEGVSADHDLMEFLLPIVKNLGVNKLKTIRLQEMINGVSSEQADAFRRLGPMPTLAKPDPIGEKLTVKLQKHPVILNWYPKIQSIRSRGVVGGVLEATPNQTHLESRHIAFLNFQRIYWELTRFKNERGWFNLNITHSGIADLLGDKSWYQLLIPAEELAFNSFDKIWLWEEIAIALLKRYTERYYAFRKNEWELPHLEYRDLTAEDSNFPGKSTDSQDGYHRILVEKSREDIIAKLKQLKTLISAGNLRPWEFNGLKAVWFSRHLYEPLLYLDQKVVEISPIQLNKGEWQFVIDLKSFHDSHRSFFTDKELYLLRNLSRGRGVGFFEAGNFYPDFIMWIVAPGMQHVIFVDPKGIRNVAAGDAKIQFYSEIKNLENRLSDPSVRLESFIISNTPSHTVRSQWNLEKAELQSRHILFQEEDKDTYIGTMMQMLLHQ